jgi:hypothetical protein
MEGASTRAFSARATHAAGCPALRRRASLAIGWANQHWRGALPAEIDCAFANGARLLGARLRLNGDCL